MANVYYVQMVERGAGHLKALCVVAARLAERAWAVMHRRMPYVICDTTGEPVTPEQAKKIIAEQWSVPTEVRTRRRSRKTAKGKAPQQVHTGHDKPDTRSGGKRGDLPHPRSSVRTTNTSSTHPPRTAAGHTLDEATAR
jgi:hypothetical protein